MRKKPISHVELLFSLIFPTLVLDYFNSKPTIPFIMKTLIFISMYTRRLQHNIFGGVAGIENFFPYCVGVP